MSASNPFGLLITWTCYGTWLPGDKRGYVSNTRVNEQHWIERENMTGAPYRADEPENLQLARQRRRWDEVWLTPPQARCVAASVVEAAQHRDWRILRGAVMSNHVHVVIADCPDDGPGVRRVLKGNSQAALSRLLGKPRKWWTEGGSNRYLHGAAAIEGAMGYVADQEKPLARIVDMRVVGNDEEV